MKRVETSTRYATREEVDFVIVGSGSAGGIMARELAAAGHSVVLLEKGPWVDPSEFRHDEWKTFFEYEWMGNGDGSHGQTFRASEDQVAAPTPFPPALYAKMVGGSSVHFTANFWRFRPVDFNERSRLGPIAGTNFADWPLTYDELEPYYTRVDWEIGVSGTPAPDDPPRSRPYPMPPLAVKSSGVLMDRAAAKLGLHSHPAPMAILSEVYDGRAPCINCGFCLAYGCEVNAKSSTLATMIPQAVSSGNCEVRPLSTVFQVALGADGRAREVRYLDKDGLEHAQAAKAVILSANGAETARLLLLSEIGNGSGMVGQNLMFNGQTAANGLFEHALNEFKGPQVTRIVHDWYDTDPGRGFYGGGGLDARFQPGTPIWWAVGGGLPPSVPTWGAGFKDALERYYTRSMTVAVHTTSLPVASNNVTLDPTHTDQHGLPSLRITYRDHDDDLATMAFLQDRAREVLDAAGAQEVWAPEVVPQSAGAHLLGTTRMGTNPDTSVVDRYHRSHEIPNLFMVDGGSFVSSGRGQPTMTIMALAFRAAEHISEFARRGEI
ncbi:MAG: GMC family oxidoreductase [Rhodothermales bacterium]|nr:GMC family oxidoreductase [Rhodothermales bacterium]MBO6778353.1 GMC family oxidoreductase [Rhodothermales bacterium]